MKTGSIKILGKNVFSTFSHYIMSLSYDGTESPKGSLIMECVTKQPEKMISGPYSVETAQRIQRKNDGKCDVFIFTKHDGKTVGTLSVMYKGGSDIEYRIRNIDAFIYNVFTEDKYRGKGYAGEMIRLLMNYLHNKSINSAYLAVSTNNISAVRAYIKAGFVVDHGSSFIRLLKVNLPYKVL